MSIYSIEDKGEGLEKEYQNLYQGLAYENVDL